MQEIVKQFENLFIDDVKQLEVQDVDDVSFEWFMLCHRLK